MSPVAPTSTGPDIVSKWPLVALGYRYQVQLGKMLDEKRIAGDHLRPYLRNVDVQWDAINVHDLPTMDFDVSDRERYALRRGDILVCEGGEVGRAAVWSDESTECYYQKALHRLRPLDHSVEHPRFLYYALVAAAASGTYSDGGKSTIAHLPAEQFRRVRLPMPPRREQERIANFLDDKTARIDALIAEKERLNEKLQKYRQLSVGFEVMGLGYKNRKHGPAAEPWLATLPTHWKCPKVKHVTTTTSGSTPNTERRELYYDGAIPWIRSLDLSDSPIAAAKVFITEAALQDTACKLLPMGTVLIAMYGGDGTIGKSGLLEFEAACNQALCAVLPSTLFDMRFLHWYMLFKRPYWMAGAEGTRKDPNISQEIVRRAHVPMPPLAEQVAIADRLDAHTTDIDRLTRHVTSHIARLREYRASLILYAVNGRLAPGTGEVVP